MSHVAHRGLDLTLLLHAPHTHLSCFCACGRDPVDLICLTVLFLSTWDLVWVKCMLSLSWMWEWACVAADSGYKCEVFLSWAFMSSPDSPFLPLFLCSPWAPKVCTHSLELPTVETHTKFIKLSALILRPTCCYPVSHFSSPGSGFCAAEMLVESVHILSSATVLLSSPS